MTEVKMRRSAIAISIATVAFPILAQTQPPPRVVRAERSLQTSGVAEVAVKQAAEQLVGLRKICERDVAVLAHLRAADDALADAMQPANVVQKAYEEVGA